MFQVRFREADDGGGGPDDDGRPTGPTDTPEDASTFGLKVLLVSLTMLFGAGLIGYAVTRYQVDEWNGYDIPGLRFGLVLSTVVLAGVSWFLHRALQSARAGSAAGMRKGLWTALVLALVFLANQGQTWAELIEFHGGVMEERDVSLFLFYILTWVHAAHVLFGFPPLILSLMHVPRYTPQRHRGLLNTSIYWHFLDIAWVLIAVALWIG